MTSSLETYTNLRGNSMDEGLLEQTANQLVAPGKGILAADESNGTMSKRLAAVGVEPSAETRRSYRANLLSTDCLLYTSPSPRDLSTSRMPSSA